MIRSSPFDVGALLNACIIIIIISKKKKQDLQRLLVYIPPIYHEFYTNIITDATSVTTHLYEDEMLNDSEDESEENQFYVEGDPETFVEKIDAVETQPN